MREIIAMAVKDLRLLLRDKAGFFFTLFFPLIIAVFFGAIFGGGGGGTRSAIPILVVDEDNTEGSRMFVAALDAASEVHIEEANRE
ncbi:MAG: ABC transporter permease [Gemmatimonadota bacterium]|nr:MAG: ABC transporter permease [Gemmatimonadota bacterium]